MTITPALKAQIEADIVSCESFVDRNGSEKLFSELVARYCVIDSSFTEGISNNGKATIKGTEFDYRPELRAIASKLKMYLLLEEIPNHVEEPKASNENKVAISNRRSFDQLLVEDIERCRSYLDNPKNDSVGQKLYTEITGRYDTVIEGFGNGLYQYYAEQHFYDPEITGDSLIHNLTILLNRMIAFQTTGNRFSADMLNKASIRQTSNKVFIVHGHDNEAIQEVARTLEKGGFEPVVLFEQPDSGLTIIEKIERHADVCYAVVLYTECDKGRDKESPVEQERFRARQNVVFEHGYLMGKIGRERVSALVKGDIEIPGDISGVVYIPMDKSGAWKMHLAKNMQDVGVPVDMNTFCR